MRNKLQWKSTAQTLFLLMCFCIGRASKDKANCERLVCDCFFASSLVSFQLRKMFVSICGSSSAYCASLIRHSSLSMRTKNESEKSTNERNAEKLFLRLRFIEQKRHTCTKKTQQFYSDFAFARAAATKKNQNRTECRNLFVCLFAPK